ncbi:phosphoserine phosphatase SerB [Undibacterium jejuense]|uniref:Phosphoserine phosphatase n=1 Tax=Undibacterium jejuense TaxID=1344949 RepID=A0A923HI95_9BURK|nr:phosphoserine phosphatase SerB [Undibacterium jejuense]MBC3862187.1 phosphoserine phosphatase SerB [Undibacterium jejuense]
MTTTSLIIQSLQEINLQHPQLQTIVALTQAAAMTSISSHAVRLEGVGIGPQTFNEIQQHCFSNAWDVTAIETPRPLSDFKLVAMDMDSTLITIECIDEIADMQGLKPQVAEITEAAMRGELEFQESLIRRVALLKGLDASALHRVFDERLQLSLGAAPMLKAIQAAGLKTLLVSGGFTFFTDRMKAMLNLDYSHSNVLEIDNGKLTGKVIGTIVDADEKQRTVERVCLELQITPQQAIVMGDGANDLKMMGIAGMSVAFRAKPVVRAQANVALNFVGLDGILNILH